MKNNYVVSLLLILFSASLLRAQTTAPTVTITSQPQDVVFCIRGYSPTVSFSVAATASNGGTLSYQWQILKGSTWVNLTPEEYGVEGATTNKVTFPFQTTDPHWTVRVAVTATNSAGSTTAYSNSASTVSYSVPVITANPTGPAYACPGSTLTLTVAAQGQKLSYKWRASYNNASVPGTGVNSPTLTIPNVQPAYDNAYYAEVSNVCGTAYSSSYELMTAQLPVIRQQPPATLVTDCSSQSTSLCVNANNDGQGPNGMGYFIQWETRAGASAAWSNVASNVTGASGGPYTGDTHCLSNLPIVANGQQYRLKFHLPNCSDVLYSAVTTLQTQTGITITSQPASSSTVCRGANVTTSVVATGDNLTYQWYKGTTLLNGSTSATLKLNNIQTSQAGSYTVKITNACGSVTSQAFNVTVTGGAPVISTTYASQTGCVGTSLQIAKPATNDASVTYQWLKDGQPVSNADNTGGLTIASLTPGDAGSYSVRVTNGCGSTTSAPFTVAVLSGATITSQPADALVNCGSSSASFSVAATGQNLTYQWETRDNSSATWVAVSGATAAQLTASGSLLTSGRQFRTRVGSSTCPGVIYSNVATLTLKSPLVFTQQPTDVAICPTGTARFSIGINNNGAGTVTIRWEYNDGGGWVAATGSGFSGGTTGNLYVNGGQLVNGRRFRAVASAAACPAEVSSNEATLRVDAGYAPVLSGVTPDQTLKSGGAIQGITASASGGNGALKLTWTRTTVAALSFNTPLAQSGTDADFPIVRTITSTATTSQSLVFTLKASDAVGCSSTAQSKVTVSPATTSGRISMGGENAVSVLTLYPNPSNGRVLYIRGSEVNQQAITLYNLKGVAIPTTNRLVEEGAEVRPLDRLPSGVYVLKIQQGATTQYRRFLVE